MRPFPFPKNCTKKRMSGSIERLFIFLAFSTFPSQIAANCRINAVLRPAEKQDALQQAWHELLELRANQSAFAAVEFPIDHRLFGSLRKCGGPHSSLDILSSASMLSPRQIGIYAEIGHLTRICPEKHFAKENAIELAELMANFRRDCTLSLSAHPQLPSLAQIFGAFGAQITLTHSEREHKDLQSWTREIVGQIQMMPGHQEQWKLVVIAPGLHDIRPGQSPLRLAHSTLQAVHIIRHKLPRRTFLLILRHSYFAFWHTLARSSAFCAKVLDLWNWEEKERVDRAWEEVEARIATNFQSEDFYVEIADLMDQGRPLPTPDRMPDVSVLGPDCAHLSARGLSLLHSQLWNWLLQPQARMHPFVPLVRPLLCPRPHCPFLLTSTNRLSCPRLPPHSAAGMMGGGSGWLGRKPSAWTPLLALLLLATAFLLYALLAGCSLAPSFLASSSTHREGRESGGDDGGLLISNRRQPISG